jgi:catecholate siderophore receptor
MVMKRQNRTHHVGPEKVALLGQSTRLPLPLLVAGSTLIGAASAIAQTEPTRELKPVLVQEKAEAPQGKDALRATDTTTGKGRQLLRDIPQSITVVTERLMDDRNLDTVKDVLHNTAGVTFLAAEGGEEDIRLRGFSMATTGDIYLDGMRDPAFYDRDTFNLDRVDLMRGSASMLFGRGSTGGVANQVSKQPHLMDEHEVSITAGSHNHRRITGDFNVKTGENAAIRVNIMKTRADNNGAGSAVDKEGVALSYRWEIGMPDEYMISLSHLDNRNPKMNYGLPWMRHASQGQADNTLNNQLSPTAYYGMASDRNAGTASMLTLSHLHRFNHDSELKTQFRRGLFTRDQRASTIRSTSTTLDNFSSASVVTRGNQFKIQDVDTVQLQSDLSHKFTAWGFKHEVLAGVDLSRDTKQVYTPRSATQGGVNLTKANTTFGITDDGAWIDEDSRILRKSSGFSSYNIGLYAQNMLHLDQHWKIVGGIRWDRMKGFYENIGIPTSAAGPETITPYQQRIADLSKRAGILYQPDARHSYHASWSTSFNTSGDTYSYNAQTVDTPPEQSRNIELGARLESDDKRMTTRLALFRATKFNERNTDPTLNVAVLSGKRHAQGLEIDVTGLITRQWEIFGSYVWIPAAKVDEAAGNNLSGGNRAGDRPGLTPKHSGTIWATYKPDARWRHGAGLNFRSQQSPADITTPANGVWTAPSWQTLDLMTEYQFNEHYRLKFNLSNVTNKYYADSLYRGHYVPGTGRLLMATLTVKL